jgi:hypothetical protein
MFKVVDTHPSDPHKTGRCMTVKTYQTIRMDTGDNGCSWKVKSLQAYVLRTMVSNVAVLFDMRIYSALTQLFLAKHCPISIICKLLERSSLAKQPLSEPKRSLEDYTRLHPVFTSLHFATIIFYRASHLTPNLEDQVPVLYVPQLYSQALFVAFYHSQGHGGEVF